MGYRTIALSQVDGAGGESVARDLAERLGYRYLSEGVIARVAADQGLDTATVAEAERRKSFVERLVQAAALAGAQGVVPDASVHLTDQTDAILALIREAVRDAADSGSVVLVGHAASYACADRPDVLRVCVTAPLTTRVSRVAATRGISEKEAAKLLRQSDAGRVSYLKRVYGVDGESPTDYDVVVNTDRLGPDVAIDTIVALAGTAGHEG